jgi:hypothetical protein
MRAAAALLVGTHDFTQFSNDSRERLSRNPVKTMDRLDLVEVEGGLRLEVRPGGGVEGGGGGLGEPATGDGSLAPRERGGGGGVTEVEGGQR